MRRLFEALVSMVAVILFFAELMRLVITRSVQQLLGLRPSRISLIPPENYLED